MTRRIRFDDDVDDAPDIQNADDDEVFDDGDENVEMGRSPIDLVPPPPGHDVEPLPPAIPRDATLRPWFLYLERGRGAQPVFQYAGPPSPGDLRRIGTGKLSVFAFGNGHFEEYAADGSTTRVRSFGE